MAFATRVEVFVVKPASHVSFVISSFHKDLFSKGDPWAFFLPEEIVLHFRKPARTTTRAFLAEAILSRINT